MDALKKMHVRRWAMFKIKLKQKERVSKREELIITLSAIGIAFVLSGIFIALNGVNPFVAL